MKKTVSCDSDDEIYDSKSQHLNKQKEKKYEAIDEISLLTTEITTDDIFKPHSIEDWRISKHFRRRILSTSEITRMGIHREVHNIYYEKIPKIKKKKTTSIVNGKKIINNMYEIYNKPYVNENFLDWQNELSVAVFEEKNIILDVVTSGGKTFACALTVGHKILTTSNTALFILPNDQVMREVYMWIVSSFRKIYDNSGMRVCHIQNDTLSTYDDRFPPKSQILCTTVDNYVDFITNPINCSFLKKLKFIVYDEVHTKLTSRSLWLKQFIPIDCKLILLSATIGNVEMLKDKIVEITSCEKDDIFCVNYDIRPIPLQHLVYVGKTSPTDGINSKNMIDKWLTRTVDGMRNKIFDFIPNVNDMTPIDTKIVLSNDDLTNIDEDKRQNVFEHIEDFTREQQYHIGQKIKTHILSENILRYQQEKIRDSLHATSTIDVSVSHYYDVLSALFSNNMAPVMIYHTEGYKIKKFVNELIEHIDGLEKEDMADDTMCEYIKYVNSMKSKLKDCGHGDDDFDKMSKKSKIDTNRNVMKRGFKSDKASSKKQQALSLVDTINKQKDTKNAEDVLRAKMLRWRFPCINFTKELRNIPLYISEALTYGIGIYTNDLDTRVKYFIFNLFKDGYINVLVSDTSLSHGINLPIRSVILCGHYDCAMFKQISGRAGRFGIDTCGYVISMFDEDTQLKCYNMISHDMYISFPREMTNYELIRLQTNDPDWNKYVSGDIRPDILRNYLAYLLKNDKEIYDVSMYKLDIIKERKLHQHQLTGLNQKMRDDFGLILTYLLSSNDFGKTIRDMTCDDLSRLLNNILCDGGNMTLYCDEKNEINDIITEQLQTLRIEKRLSVSSNTILYDLIKGKDDKIVSNLYNNETLFSTHYMIGWIWSLKKYINVMIGESNDNFKLNILKIDELVYKSCLKYHI